MICRGKTLSRSLTALAVALIALPTSAPAAPVPLYRVELIAPDTTGSGEARAVNAAGDVAGQYQDAAFVWHAGHFTSYPPVHYFYFDGDYTNIATAINRHGVAAGHDGSYMPCSMSGLQLATAVTYQGTSMHFIDRSRDGECSYEADGINDRGTIVGERGYRGFVHFADDSEIAVRPLSTRPEYNGTRATAIDNENHVVGATTVDVSHVPQVPAGQWTPYGGRTQQLYGPDTNAYVIHAFLLTLDGETQRMRDLGTIAGFPNTYATAINEDLTVVGYSGTESGPKWTRVSGASHAWVWQHGRMTDLGGPNNINPYTHGVKQDIDSFAYGVNDASIIVGCANDNAVRWVNKRMQDLNTLIDPHSGWHLSCARAINRDGVIVGSGSYGKSGELPFRLVPLVHGAR